MMTAMTNVPMTKPAIMLFTPFLYLWYKYATGKTYNEPAMKFAGMPIGSVAPFTTKYIKFFKKTTSTPAIGEKINPANNAGTSLKSTFKYGGNNGNGKLRKNRTNDTVAKSAITTIFVNFDEPLRPCNKNSSFAIDSCNGLEEKRYFFHEKSPKTNVLGHRCSWKKCAHKKPCIASSSPIQTFTVGSGFSPDQPYE